MSQADPDAEFIRMSDDQQAVALREIADIMHGLTVLANELTKGRTVQTELMRNILYISDASLANLAHITGIETESAVRRAERHTRLQIANDRVRELEHLLGAGASTEQTQMSVKRLLNRVRQWWRTEGLGHLSDIHLDEYGQLDMKLSCHLFGNFSSVRAATPLSDKRRKEQWFDAVRARGFVLNDAESSQDSVLDCDASRQALIALVTAVFPSAQVCGITNQAGPDGRLMMVDAHVHVRKLADLESLPG